MDLNAQRLIILCRLCDTGLACVHEFNDKKAVCMNYVFDIPTVNVQTLH